MLLLALFACATELSAHGTEKIRIPNESSAQALDEITVLGRRENIVGTALSASQGEISAAQIQSRAITRAGDLAEFVPGLIATQHSGNGKANQYFLRGFNLDHATDFATYFEDMPVNMRSHGHGQGYSDLNFVIPEMIGEIRYRKGPYFADAEDFSSAGAASFRMASLQDNETPSVIGLTIGEFGYQRTVAMHELSTGANGLYLGVEAQGYDGPWRDINEDTAKRNFNAKYTRELENGRLRASALAYDNRWNSADQIPARAVASGLLSEYGQIDRDVGGESSRYSLSMGYAGTAFGGWFDASMYGIDYDLDLYSNFSYLLNDPESGDEFNQFDQRRIFGGQASQSFSGDGYSLRVGVDSRIDLIANVGLAQTAARVRQSLVRADRVREASVAAFVDGEWKLSERLRAYAGLRFDDYQFQVTARDCDQAPINCSNSGRASAHIASPKLSLIYTLNDQAEFYLSGGRGFHSNDARGSAIRVDPLSGASVDPVTPLAKTKGVELGARGYLNDQLHTTLAVWHLQNESELIYVGDAGTTEAGPGARRNGVEFGAYYFANERLNVDLEASYTKARFAAAAPNQNYIPGAIPLTLALGLNAQLRNDLRLSAHVRHFSNYPLLEDNSVQSEGSTLVNVRLAKQFDQWLLSADLLNALNSREHDIDYYYASRLPGEASEGVEDIHFRILEPRALRLNVQYRF
jgi:hypothetical protein